MMRRTTLTASCLAPLSAHAAVFVDRPGAVDLSAEITSSARLAIHTHDLGSDVLAHVATYREIHTQEMRNESIEILAYAGDRVDFSASASGLVATRSGYDLRSIPEALARTAR